MDTSRSHDPWARLDAPARAAPSPDAPRRGAPQGTAPYGANQFAQPSGQRTSHDPAHHGHQQPPVQQRTVRVPPPAAVTVQRAPVARRLLGVLLLLVLTALSLPVHIAAVFFAYVQVESPGDPATGVLLVGGSVLASFLALLVTASVAQAAGGFPARWRARVTFAALSAAMSVAATYLAAVTLF